MKSISNNATKTQEVVTSLSRFFKQFGVGKALKQANAYKSKGYHPIELMQYLVQLVYLQKSMYRDSHDRQNSMVGASKDAVYRFLRNSSINWSKLMIVLSARVIAWVNSLTSENRLNALVLDDTMYHRPYSKKTELTARQFDHTDRKYKCGFRSLFLGWTDGTTFIPVLFRHMSSTKKDVRYRECRSNTDKRTCGSKFKAEAVMKSTDVALRMLKDAKRFLLPAKYVLFDSWFTNPQFVIAIRKIGYHVVGRLKKSNTYYYVNGEKKTLVQIYNTSKKRRGRSHYLLSAAIVMKTAIGIDTISIDARIVFVRNKHKRKEWIAFLCTDMDLTEDQIIELYGKRWGIEVFFKTCKSYLKFTGEFRQTSYEAITAHTTIVVTRYMMLAVEQRMNTDMRRTPGDLFFYFADEAKDIRLEEVLAILLDELLHVLSDDLRLNDAETEKLVSKFIGSLPPHLRLPHILRNVS